MILSERLREPHVPFQRRMQALAQGSTVTTRSSQSRLFSFSPLPSSASASAPLLPCAHYPPPPPPPPPSPPPPPARAAATPTRARRAWVACDEYAAFELSHLCCNLLPRRDLQCHKRPRLASHELCHLRCFQPVHRHAVDGMDHVAEGIKTERKCVRDTYDGESTREASRGIRGAMCVSHCPGERAGGRVQRRAEQ